MLILTRKKGQSLRIDEKIVVKILDMDGDSIKIGIEAPKSVNIIREEIYLEVSNDNKAVIKTGNNLSDLINSLKSRKTLK